MGTVYNPEEYPVLLREYAGYKLVIQGCSPRTVNEYMLDLRAFFRFLLAKRGLTQAKHGTEEYENISLMGVDVAIIDKVEPSDIYDFMFFLERDCDNAPAARARKLSAIKGMYKYLSAKRGLITHNPAVDIESPKNKKTLPKYLTYEEAVLLLNTVRGDSEAVQAKRNYCMITLFLNCGMRLSELVGINLGDLDRYLRSVRVIGKGNKERIIYLNDACRMALGEYLPERNSPEKATVSTRALFITSRGTRISNRAVQAAVTRYLEAAGLGYRHFSVHKLRHTAATLMYRSGHVDVRVLKEILGHEQLNTTQIYTHVANSDIENAMAKNPLAEIRPDGGTLTDGTAVPTAELPFDSMTGEPADKGRDDIEPDDDTEDPEDSGDTDNGGSTDNGDAV